MSNMMNLLTFPKRAVLSILAAVCSMHVSAAIEGTAFYHKDWEMACDNTGTCRAVGYSPESHEKQLAVYLERAAGAEAQVIAQVRLQDEESTLKSLHVQLPTLVKTTVPIKNSQGKLNPQQTRELLKAIQGTQPIQWQGGKQRWWTSTEGSSAVLLKMDEFQHRIATPSALLRKGNQPNTQVLPPQALPVIYWQKPKSNAKQQLTSTHPQYKKLKALMTDYLEKPDSEEDCSQLSHTTEPFTVYNLNPQQRLVEASCWRAAYNVGNSYWLMNNTLTKIQSLVTIASSGYDQGIITDVQKWRGLGDCMDEKQWIWNGQAFQQSFEASAMQCRGFAGGAWELPIYRSKLVELKTTK